MIAASRTQEFLAMFGQQRIGKIGDSGNRLRLRDGLVYLPGALVLAYGFWLTLTA
jgi:hypothetical protein